MTQAQPSSGEQKLRRNSALNFASTLVDFAGRLIVTFLLNPKILVSLGPANYGIWQVLNRLISYLSAPGGRPGQGLSYQIARTQHTASDDDRRRLVGGALWVWLLFSPVYLVGGGLLLYFLPACMEVPPGSETSLRIALAILILYVMLNELGLIPCSALGGMNMKHRLMGNKIYSNFAMFLAAWALLELGLGLIGLSIAQVVSALSLGGFGLIMARRHLPWFGARRPKQEEIRETLSFNGLFLLSSVLDMSLKSMEVLLLGFVVGPEIVTTYTITSFAPNLALTIAALTGISATPGLAGIMGSGQFARVRRARKDVLSLVWMICISISTATLLTNQNFVGLWMGATYFGGKLLCLLLVLATIQLSLISLDNELINASLQLGQKTKITFATLLCSVVLGGIGLHYGSMVGLTLGFMAGRLIQTVCYPALVGRQIEVTLTQQLLKIHRPALVSVLLLGTAYVAPEPPQFGWIGFLLLGSAVGGLALLLAFFLGIDPETRKTTLDLVRSKLRKKT